MGAGVTLLVTHPASTGAIGDAAADSQQARGTSRKGWGARGFVVSVVSVLVAFAVAGVTSAAAAQGQPAAADDGRGVWASPTLTVHVADEAAWSGTDVEAALAQWGPVMRMTLTDDAHADITLTSGPAAEYAGATAYRSTSEGVIHSCRVDLAARVAGRNMTPELTHELGHCLGIGHTKPGAAGPSVMWRASYGPHFSPTVTAADLDAVRALYR